MKTRRTFLKLVLAAAAALPIPMLAGRAAPLARAPGFHLVNGWILTDADLEALEKHVG